MIKQKRNIKINLWDQTPAHLITVMIEETNKSDPVKRINSHKMSSRKWANMYCQLSAINTNQIL